jgi:Tol biopolymer transport system component
MSDEKKTSLAGIVELAHNFTIIQPRKSRTAKSWLVPLFIIIIIALSLWLYNKFTRPLIRIVTESKQVISENAVSGIPYFLDNETIVYSRNDESDSVILVFKQLSPAGRQAYTKFHRQTEYRHPTMSSSEDQTFVWILAQYKTPRIYSVNLDGTTQTLAQGEWASFSGDGTKIAFQKSNNGQTEIWIMNSDGSNQNSMGLKGQHPEFSPKKDQLVFESKNKKGSSLIQRVNIYDTPYVTKALTTDKDNCMYPSFSPDGKIILFYKKGDGLWAMKSNGSKQQRVLKSGKSETIMGRISPDGKRIAVWSSPDKLTIYKIEYKKIKPSNQKVDIERLATSIDTVNEADELPIGSNQ